MRSSRARFGRDMEMEGPTSEAGHYLPERLRSSNDAVGGCVHSLQDEKILDVASLPICSDVGDDDFKQRPY